MAESFTRIPNYFIDEMLTKLTPYQSVIMVAIYRRTVGWEKKETTMSIDEISAATNIKKRSTIIDALKILEEIGLITLGRKKGGRGRPKTLIKIKKRLPEVTKTEETNESPTVTLTGNNKVPLGTAKTDPGELYSYIINTKNIKEREKGVFPKFPFLEELEEEELNNLVEKYLRSVSKDARHPSAYRGVVRKKINKRDPETLEELQIWHRVSALNELREAYLNRSIGEELVADIYSKAEADQIEGHDPARFDPEQRWFLRLRSHARRRDRIVGYPSRRELEAAVRSALSAALADSSAGDAA